MKQVFPRFCNPVKPKVPASHEPPEKDEELLLVRLEVIPLPEPFIRREEPLRYDTDISSFFALFLTESDNP